MMTTAALAAGQSTAPQSATAPLSIEDEVLANLRNQRVGEDQTLADYNLPESFLRTVADRVIRTSFEERYRLIVRDAPPGAVAAAAVPATAGDSSSQSPSGPSSPHQRRMSRALGLVLVVPLLIIAALVWLKRGGKPA